MRRRVQGAVDNDVIEAATSLVWGRRTASGTSGAVI